MFCSKNTTALDPIYLMLLVLNKLYTEFWSIELRWQHYLFYAWLSETGIMRTDSHYIINKMQQTIS